MPPVGALMTPFPHTAEVDTPVSDVLARMEAEDFRHLPVVREGALVGIVSIRDIARRTRWDEGGAHQPLEAHQVMTPDPYIVETGEPLATVLREMVARKIGTALIAKRAKLVGILTLTDICDAFADILEARYEPDSVA
jgi:CBS domain-containing protein